jgi:hypothetical protein
MKKISDLFLILFLKTKNNKNRNLLHIFIGGVICLPFIITSIFSGGLFLFVGLLLTLFISMYWEYWQKINFNAKFSVNDIIMTNLIILVYIFFYYIIF